MPKLSLAAMSNLMKSSGAQRVSDSAKKKLREILESKAIEITNDAIKFAKYKGRSTVQAEDIEKALVLIDGEEQEEQEEKKVIQFNK